MSVNWDRILMWLRYYFLHSLPASHAIASQSIMQFALASHAGGCALRSSCQSRRLCAVRASLTDTPDTVTLNCDGHREKIRLINNRIQLSAVKEVFNLANVKLNGQIEPVDGDGFTLSEFQPRTMINVTGQPVLDMMRLASELSALRDDLDKLSRLPDDIKAIKRLVAEVTCKTCEEPDVVGADGYAWGTWKESMDMAREIIRDSTTTDRSKNSMDDIAQMAIS